MWDVNLLCFHFGFLHIETLYGSQKKLMLHVGNDMICV